MGDEHEFPSETLTMSRETSSVPLFVAIAMSGAGMASCVEHGADHSENGGSITAEATVPPEHTVDDQGRWVVRLGSVELRIPKEMRSRPPSDIPYEIYPTALCLHEEFSLADPSCYELDDRIRIFLIARSLTTPKPKCNVERNLAEGILRGPYKTTNRDVQLYKSEDGVSRQYVFRDPDEECRYPTADCNALACLAGFTPRPGVLVRYEFVGDAISNWPSIHQRVVDHATLLIAEE